MEYKVFDLFVSSNVTEKIWRLKFPQKIWFISTWQCIYLISFLF